MLTRTLLLSVIFLSSCNEKMRAEKAQATDSASAPSTIITTPASASVIYPTDQWVGQWNGPEGTFLKISGAQGNYEIVIQNLDGPTRHLARANEDHIEFDRNGVMESIRATNGAGTGMKWLTEKYDCLVIRKGEGFCKD